MIVDSLKADLWKMKVDYEKLREKEVWSSEFMQFQKAQALRNLKDKIETLENLVSKILCL